MSKSSRTSARGMQYTGDGWFRVHERHEGCRQPTLRQTRPGCALSLAQLSAGAGISKQIPDSSNILNIGCAKRLKMPTLEPPVIRLDPQARLRPGRAAPSRSLFNQRQDAPLTTGVS